MERSAEHSGSFSGSSGELPSGLTARLSCSDFPKLGDEGGLPNGRLAVGKDAPVRAFTFWRAPLLAICFILTTLGVRRSETIERDGLGSWMSRFEGRARKEEMGEGLDSVRAVLVHSAYFELLTCSSVLTTVLTLRCFDSDATPEPGAQDVASGTTLDLVSPPARMEDSDGRRLSTRVEDFDEVRETVVAVSIDDFEGDFLWKSVLRALDNLSSIRELREFLWSSRGIERELGFDELGRVWERVI
jgi:hypothetical protein